MIAIIYWLCVTHSANCFIPFTVFTPQTTLQGKQYLSCFTELGTDSDRSAVCFKSPSCSNWGPFDSKSPRSLGYTTESLHGFIAKLGVDLGFSLWIQERRGSMSFHCSRSCKPQASRRERNAELSFNPNVLSVLRLFRGK